MSARTQPAVPEDCSHVNVTRHAEILWWAEELRVTPQQVRDAVVEVGPSAEEIKKHLREAAKLSFKNLGED